MERLIMLLITFGLFVSTLVMFGVPFWMALKLLVGILIVALGLLFLLTSIRG